MSDPSSPLTAPPMCGRTYHRVVMIGGMVDCNLRERCEQSRGHAGPCGGHLVDHMQATIAALRAQLAERDAGMEGLSIRLASAQRQLRKAKATIVTLTAQERETLPIPCVCHCEDGLVREWVSKARAVAKAKGYQIASVAPQPTPFPANREIREGDPR